MVSPDLLTTLQTVSPDKDIAVIINLADRVDLNQMKANDKAHKRDKLVKEFKDKANLTQGFLKGFLQSRGAKRMIPFWITNSIAVTVPPSVIGELVSFPGIESIEVDALIPAPAPPAVLFADPPPPFEWNIGAINAPALWTVGYTGAGTVVANMDTGVDLNHPDVSSKWRGGTNSWFNPYSEPANAGLCATPDQCTSCELSSVPCDDEGHGTGTMGVMVGGNAGGTAIGVAPDAKWIAVKIFPAPGSGAPSSVILEGFQWVLGLLEDAPDVVNNSWGFDTRPNVCDTVFQQAITNLKAAGIAVVFSAGNRGPGASTSVSPANNPGSFAVGATDINNSNASNSEAFFSSRGPSACNGSIFPQVVAPGAGIRVASPGGLYFTESGTSFSAPHVSGAMALLLSTFPNLIPVQLETTLKQTALPLGSPIPNNDYGYGLIDLNAAYNTLLPQNPYIITASEGTGGSISPVGNLHIAQGDDLTFRITPNNPHYHIQDVLVDGGSVCEPDCGNQTSYTFTNIQGDHTIAVTFSINGDTVGLFNPNPGTFYLRNSNSAGPADVSFRYGPANSGWISVSGDWDRDGKRTIGLYNPATGTFYLKNTNAAGPADITFRYGPANSGWIPVAGDWNSDGIDTVGLFNPNPGTFYLRNSNSAGPADVSFRYGPANSGWIPVAGDWNSDGIDTVGLFNPIPGIFYLRNSNSAGPADVSFRYGPANSGWIPVAGDWNSDGIDTVGLFDRVKGIFYLRNTNTPGTADRTFRYGPVGAGWKPIVGDWDGLP